VLDVLKPWPARRLEALRGGSGIMADDLMVGLYANLILHGLSRWYPAWLGLA
jgi:phosphatidylglycerophosphatase A